MLKKVLMVAVVALGLMVSSTAAFAATSGWSNPTTVTAVYSGDTALVVFGAMLNAGCSDASYIKVDTSTVLGQKTFDVLLAAYLSGRPVRYRINGCNYYPSLFNIQIQ